MKHLFVALFSLSLFSLCAQETLQGTIIDLKTKTPLPYVNIGIPGKNIGTVSDFSGKFSLVISDSLKQDSIRISSIGYISNTMAIAQFKSKLKKSNTFSLKKETLEFKEVVIQGKELKSKVLGSTTKSQTVTAGFTSDLLGNEIGILIKTKKRKTILDSFNFYIAYNDYDSLKFRFNVYTLKDGLPDVNILRESIIIETKVKQGDVFVDLTNLQNKIVVYDDFAITVEAIEWQPSAEKKSLYFSAGLIGGTVIARETSQAEWKKIPPITLGFNVHVRR